MPPIRNVGSRVPSVAGSSDVPQPTRPVENRPAAPTGASGRSMFEGRAGVENLTRHDGSPNTTWTQMTSSLGEAFDLRKQGRAVDTNLLYELSRYERDPMPQRKAAAELAAMGAIDAKAMEQITNNSNFEGFNQPLEDRLAFALVMNTGGANKPIESYPMNSGKPMFDVAAEVLGKPRGGEWLTTAKSQAKELLQAAQNNTLLDSPAFAALLKSKLPDGGAGLPAALAQSPRALLTYQAATASGANADQAKALAEKAANGQLDAVAFRALAPSAAWNGNTLFSEQFGTYAIAPGLSLDEAAKVAGQVAKGELGFGQLHGFMVRFGAADDWPRPMISVPTAAELVVAVNKGEVTEAGLDKALSMGTYFPSSLANKIWDHFFSGKDENGGNKYTVSGVAPESTYTAALMQKFDAKTVVALANSDDKRAAFARAFDEKLNAGLPHGLGVFWDRVSGGAKDEQKAYAALVDGAFAAAKQAAGI